MVVLGPFVLFNVFFEDDERPVVRELFLLKVDEPRQARRWGDQEDVDRAGVVRASLAFGSSSVLGSKLPSGDG